MNLCFDPAFDDFGDASLNATYHLKLLSPAAIGGSPKSPLIVKGMLTSYVALQLSHVIAAVYDPTGANRDLPQKVYTAVSGLPGVMTVAFPDVLANVNNVDFGFQVWKSHLVSYWRAMGKTWGPINGKYTNADYERLELARLVANKDDTSTLAEKKEVVEASSTARREAQSLNGKNTNADFKRLELTRLVANKDDPRTLAEKMEVVEASSTARREAHKKAGRLTKAEFRINGVSTKGKRVGKRVGNAVGNAVGKGTSDPQKLRDNTPWMCPGCSATLLRVSKPTLRAHLLKLGQDEREAHYSIFVNMTDAQLRSNKMTWKWFQIDQKKPGQKKMTLTEWVQKYQKKSQAGLKRKR